jgi:four helix bundle protein
MEKEIYKRCFDFALDIIKFSKKFNQDTAYKIIASQLIRSATSISANIAEGSASVSKKEFVNYIGIARKSAVETTHWLRFLFELCKDKKIKQFIDESRQIVNILSKIVINAKKR